MAFMESCIIYSHFQTLCQFIAMLHIYSIYNTFSSFWRVFFVICNVLQKDLYSLRKVVPQQ